MKQSTKTKPKAYYHVMYGAKDLKFRYPGESCKNLTLTEAKTVMNDRVKRAVKNYRLMGATVVNLYKTSSRVKFRTTYVNGDTNVVTYMIKKTINPIK